MKIQIIFYSMYGHIYKMGQAVLAGTMDVPGADVQIFQVPELIPEEILEKSGAKTARQAFAHVPTAKVEELVEADAIIFGAPTRFGMICAKMRNFLDQTGGLWAKNALVGIPVSVFTSTSTQHGGQESTILSFHTTLLHHGMIIVGVPYSEKRQFEIGEISGGSPYGASTIAGPDGKRTPTDNELAIARFQGRHVAEITRDLAIGRKAI